MCRAMLAPFRFGIQFVADIDPILRETALLTFRDIILFRLDAIIKHCCFLLHRTLRGFLGIKNKATRIAWPLGLGWIRCLIRF